MGQRFHLIIFQSWASTLNASSHLVALAVDRVLSIIFPVWHHNLLIVPTARKISLMSTVFCYCSVLPNFYIFGLRDEICIITYKEHPELLDVYQNFVQYTLFTMGPSILIFISNIVFIIKLRIIRQNSRNMRAKNNIMVSTKSDNSPNQKLLAVTGTTNDQPSSSCPNNNSDINLMKEIHIPIDTVPTNQNSCQKLTNLDTNPGPAETDVDAIETNDDQVESDEGYSDLTDGIYIKPGVYISTNFGPCNPPSEPVTPDLSNTDVSRFDVLKDPMLETPTEEAERPNGKQESSGKSKVNKNLTDEEQKRNKVDRSVVFMLLAVCCTYLVFTGSGVALHMLSQINVTPELGKGEKKFLRAASEVPVIMNNSLNFIFYFFCGQTFRNTFDQKRRRFFRI